MKTNRQSERLTKHIVYVTIVLMARKRVRIRVRNKVPIENGTNGRTSKGRFAPGNRCAVNHGGPHARRRAEVRSILMETPDADLRDVIKTLIREAKRGEGWAVKEVMDRWMGKPLMEDRREDVELFSDLKQRLHRTELAELVRNAPMIDGDEEEPDKHILDVVQAVLELGGSTESIPAHLGLTDEQWADWVKMANDHFSQHRKTPFRDLMRILRKSLAAHELENVIESNLQLLERRNPEVYGRKRLMISAGKDDELDPDERFM